MLRRQLNCQSVYAMTALLLQHPDTYTHVWKNSSLPLYLYTFTASNLLLKLSQLPIEYLAVATTRQLH